MLTVPAWMTRPKRESRPLTRKVKIGLSLAVVYLVLGALVPVLHRGYFAQNDPGVALVTAWVFLMGAGLAADQSLLRRIGVPSVAMTAFSAQVFVAWREDHRDGGGASLAILAIMGQLGLRLVCSYFAGWIVWVALDHQRSRRGAELGLAAVILSLPIYTATLLDAVMVVERDKVQQADVELRGELEAFRAKRAEDPNFDPGGLEWRAALVRYSTVSRGVWLYDMVYAKAKCEPNSLCSLIAEIAK